MNNEKNLKEIYDDIDKTDDDFKNQENRLVDEEEENLELEQEKEAKEAFILDGNKEEIEKALEEETKEEENPLLTETTHEVPKNLNIYEPIETEMMYGEKNNRNNASKIGGIALIIAGIIAVFGITFALFAYTDSSKLVAFRYKVDGYEIPTIMGFLEKEAKAVDFKKGIAEDVNGRYAIYLYNVDDFDYDAFNKYIEYFIKEGYDAYTVSDGAMVLYKFVDNDVLNLTFYPYDNFVEVTFTVYDYVEEDFAWMKDYDETGKITNLNTKTQ